MTKDRGTAKYENVDVESAVRALYEARQPLQNNDFLYGNEFSAGELVTFEKRTVEDVLVRNPSGSGRYFSMFPTYIVGGARVEAQKKKNVSVDSLGPELEVVNQRTDFSNDAAIQVNRDNTYTETSDTKAYPARLVGAQKSDTFQVEAEELLVAPGTNVLVEINNPTSDDARGTIYLDLIEIPAGVLETIGEDFS